jgi:hypothetical protein
VEEVLECSFGEVAILTAHHLERRLGSKSLDLQRLRLHIVGLNLVECYGLDEVSYIQFSLFSNEHLIILFYIY